MKWIRRGAAALLVLVLVVATVIVTGLLLGQRRAERRIDLTVAPIALPTEAAAVQRGQYLYRTLGCSECHGADGAGATIADDGHGVKVAGPNITSGNPRIASYRPVDWVRTIRHGVAADGHALRLMPSEDYNQLTDDDLGGLVAYVLALPHKDGPERGTIALPLPARVLYGFGAIPEAAARIDHTRPPPPPVPNAVTVEHGRYVAQLCRGCHGSAFEGGKIVGAPPDWPEAARLAPGKGDVMPRYPTASSFISMFRTGHRPDGSAIAVMPFASLKQMSDTDVQALHLYLSGLTPR